MYLFKKLRLGLNFLSEIQILKNIQILNIFLHLFPGVIDNLVVDDSQSSDEEDVPLSNKKAAKTKKGQNKTKKGQIKTKKGQIKIKKGQKKKSTKIQSSDSEEYIPSEEEYTPGKGY